MSRGLGWLEQDLFKYLRRQGGAASYDGLLNYSWNYEYRDYRSRFEAVRRALRSLSRKGYVEKEVYKGVVIYTVRTRSPGAHGGGKPAIAANISGVKLR